MEPTEPHLLTDGAGFANGAAHRAKFADGATD
jgi:hypothetical protein